ncbi:hypothetical protein BAC3_00372 [uncultured bacterium]|nr:hypothetical protein BAC3_00372 [uncultured bacterium]
MKRMTPEQIETEIKKELTRFHLFTRLKVLLLEVRELRKEITILEAQAQ